MMRKLISLAADRRGAATVELALVLPVILGVFLTGYGVWDAASRHQNLNAALDAGEQYYINGGSSDDTASQAIQSAWQYRPSNSSINVVRSCSCAGVAQSCTTLCSGGIAPTAYVQMSLSSTDQSAFMTPSQSASRVVRVR